MYPRWPQYRPLQARFAHEASNDPNPRRFADLATARWLRSSGPTCGLAAVWIWSTSSPLAALADPINSSRIRTNDQNKVRPFAYRCQNGWARCSSDAVPWSRLALGAAVYSQWRCRARPVVNGTSQPDLLFETSCSFSRCPFRRPPSLSAVQTGPAAIGAILANGKPQLSISR
jgi:hypothetical protein